MCDFGTGNNNKLNWVLEDKQELIDIIETIYRGAKKGRGLVVSPKGTLGFLNSRALSSPEQRADHVLYRLFHKISLLARQHRIAGLDVLRVWFMSVCYCPSISMEDSRRTAA